MLQNLKKYFSQATISAVLLAMMLLTVIFFWMVGDADAVEPQEEDVIIWRISAVKTGNALFSISSSIAANISLPFNTQQACTKEHCGVRSLVALARTRFGIIDLLREVTLGETESAILPLDIVYAAYNGQLISLENYSYKSLRLLAPVTSLPVHIITHPQTGISDIDDVSGNIVAFVPDADRTAATHFNRILQAYEIDPATVEYVFLSSQEAKAALIADDVQIVVMTGQDPIAEIRDLDREHPIKFLTLHRDKVQQILKDWPYFYTSQKLSVDSYSKRAKNVLTLGTSYVWVTRAESDENLVHDMVRALWHPGTKKLLRNLNPHATMPENLQGDLLLIKGLEYHRGALRYYRENGLF